MNKKIKTLGAIAVTTTMLSTSVYAAEQTITADFGKIGLSINGISVAEETLLYNGITYVPIRATAEILNMGVDYDNATNTAILTSAGVSENPPKNVPVEPPVAEQPIYEPTVEDTIRQSAVDKWGDDQKMVDYEYNKQLQSYNNVLEFPASGVKDYSMDKWTDLGITDWSMVEYEYNKQMKSYDYMQGISDGQNAIDKWTKNGFTDWSMVEYEYRK